MNEIMYVNYKALSALATLTRMENNSFRQRGDPAAMYENQIPSDVEGLCTVHAIYMCGRGFSYGFVFQAENVFTSRAASTIFEVSRG